MLTPAAQDVDRRGQVPRSHLDALAAAGLFGLQGPPSHGGCDAPTSVVREVHEVLAGACGATYFVWVQHHLPVRLLARAPAGAGRDELLPDLCAGRRIAGVAHAHLRRPGPPAVRARWEAGGLRLDGRAPWVTSWGLADLVAVGARLPTGDVVFGAVPGRAGDGVRPTPPLALAAMGATATVALDLDGVTLPRAAVICEVPGPAWDAGDRLATVQPSPAAFGLAATCLRLLADRDAAAAEALGCRWAALRERSYRTADSAGPDPTPAQRAELAGLRAESLELGLRAAAALVAATGGRSMLADDPAQRLLREAAFYLIQAQTPPVRRGVLDRLAGLPPGCLPSG